MIISGHCAAVRRGMRDDDAQNADTENTHPNEGNQIFETIALETWNLLRWLYWYL